MLCGPTLLFSDLLPLLGHTPLWRAPVWRERQVDRAPAPLPPAHAEATMATPALLHGSSFEIHSINQFTAKKCISGVRSFRHSTRFIEMHSLRMPPCSSRH